METSEDQSQILPTKKSYQRVVPIGQFVIEIPGCSLMLTGRHSTGQGQYN
jgi:hypothetical protein